MLHVIYNKETGEILRARARSVGMFVRNYKTESAAKAALTRLDKKGLLGEKVIDTRREDGTRLNVNIMSGKTYMEAEDTPCYMSPSCESYWSM
jgi:hypothetical protein